MEKDLSPDLDSDILHITGVKMKTKSFRACIFILDELLSCYDCHQFLVPVPSTAFVYHKEIKNPMDFRTLEYNLYNNKYNEFQDFILDLNLIWNNAKQFHRSFDAIYQQAENLSKRFESIVTFLDGGERPFYLSSAMDSVDMITDTILPEEKVTKVHFPMYKEIKPKTKSNLYFIHAFKDQDPLAKKIRGYANVRILFQNLNSTFFHYIDSMSNIQHRLPLPRFYIAKNRTLLHQARADLDGTLAVLYNVHVTPVSGDILQLRATVIHCEPMEDTHNFDENSMNKSDKYEYCPKAWLKLKIIRVCHNVEAFINADMDRNFFRKAYNTFKVSTKTLSDIKKVGNHTLAKEFAKAMLEPRSAQVNTPIPSTSAPAAPKPPADKGKQVQTRLSAYNRSKTESATPPLQSESIPSTVNESSPMELDDKTNTPEVSKSMSSTKKPSELPSVSKTDEKQKGSTSQGKNLIRIPTPESFQQPPPPSSKPLPSQKPKPFPPLTTPKPEVLPQASLKPNPSAPETLTDLSTQPDQLQQLTSALRAIGKSKPSPPSSEQPDLDSTSKPVTTIRLILKKSSRESSPDSRNQEIINISSDNSEDGRSEVAPTAYTENESDDETASYEYSESEDTEYHDTQQSLDLHKNEELGHASTVNKKTQPSPEVTEELGVSLHKSSRKGSSSSSVMVKQEEGTVVLNDYYSNIANELWHKLTKYAEEKNVPVIDTNEYGLYRSLIPNAEGFFKHVFFSSYDSNKVIQTFKRMSISQRATEIVGLIALKGKPHIGQIQEVIRENGGEIIGLCMERYEKTLKEYTHAHSHHRLTAHQKMDLVIQMLESIRTIHGEGIAHRDLSEVNFMVNSTDEKLRDGSLKAELFLIDFGKSTFVNPVEYKRWWVEQPENNENEHRSSEIIPKTKEELDFWCQKLPWIRSKPDHGYRLYRSIQTLPKNRLDNDNLPWLVNPMAEDLYSIGTLIWKTFSETEPWYGMLDTDLKGLREKVSEDFGIEKSLQREVPGELSRQLLLKFLKVDPLQRQSAEAVLSWIGNMHIQNGLIREWEQYAPVSRQKRHAKSLYRYEEEQASETRKKKKPSQNK